MPTVIYNTLKEEKQRNLEMQQTYMQEIAELRKGSIYEKVISGKTYYYLKYRQGDKVKNDYIGKDEETAAEVKREIERRKYLIGILKRLKQEYRQICMIVKE